MKVRRAFVLISVTLIVLLAVLYPVWPSILWSMLFFGPLILLGYSDILQRKQSIKRNFPVIGHMRYLLEKVRPEIMQYFVETDIEGTPINRQFRSVIYQRAKKVNDTTPFGTRMDVYRVGYEWMDHSLFANEVLKENESPRVIIGGKDCNQPYSASILNISAMSFGALSKNAVLAMNRGAKMGGFSQNTGEGGISPYHIEPQGDLVWQIGTAYFGCRTKEGEFCPDKFKETASSGNVKMIEIKISQGAKPGHGGILPASKNTEEIAKIRQIEPHIAIHSPPRHSAFSDQEGLMHFIKKLRELSKGKPIGFKLCVGRKDEFIGLCKAMITTGIKPDFITIDGGEGGTGAAPVEFSNSLGLPLRDGLALAVDLLNGFGLRDEIKLIASGKIFTGFHMARVFALGADLCNSSRAMMMATGCIQALHCNTNKCPVGVATQDKSLMKGLNVSNKAERVANYHGQTVQSFVELLAAGGFSRPDEIRREHLNRRVSSSKTMNYSEIYPEVEPGTLLNSGEIVRSVNSGAVL